MIPPDSRSRQSPGVRVSARETHRRRIYIYIYIASIRRDTTFAGNLGEILGKAVAAAATTRRLIVSACLDGRARFTIATSDDVTAPRARVPRIPPRRRQVLCAIDIYGAIYILPNILSLGKWPQARAKLLNIQAGNEAKFVCVNVRSGH